MPSWGVGKQRGVLERCNARFGSYWPDLIGSALHCRAILLAGGKEKNSLKPSGLLQCSGCVMGVLVIKCPNTGQPFSTGIHVDGETLARVPQEFTHTHCPYCKLNHSWLPREAQLVDAIPPSEWIENQVEPKR